MNDIDRGMSVESLSRWRIPPAAQWRHKFKSGLAASGLLWPFLGLGLIGMLVLVVIVLWEQYPQRMHWWIAFAAMCLVAAGALVMTMVGRVQRNLVVPLTHVRHWAARMRGGNLRARIPNPAHGEFKELASDINNLSESLFVLTREMQAEVEKQTERVAQQSNSLRVLYDVATSINGANDLDELLTQFLNTLRDLVQAEAATVRILGNDGHLHLAASIGMSCHDLPQELHVPIDRCHCGKAVRELAIQCSDVQQCERIIEAPLLPRRDLRVIAVPLQYRGEVLGVYNLFVQRDELVDNEEFTGLLTSIGKQLGIAIAKTRLEVQARRLALMEERTLLSHELHDSLAQTLASLRFQVQMLDDSMMRGNTPAVREKIKDVHAGLENANHELRELLEHFRARMDERGLIPAIRELTQRLERDTGIAVYFQDETKHQNLSPSNEVQVLHIVQEALSNARKHSKAQNVRVLLRADVSGHWHVLVEDDGEGMALTQQPAMPGEHIGLKIMQERASHLNGQLSIESEPGEGTRVELVFEAAPAHRIATATIYKRTHFETSENEEKPNE
ncbi:MAG: GAF domain-containing protein [Gammaproteobacteria bacterium]|nr:GAF domain-containing protein [Gammaproteobacteria bacterium]